MTVSRRLFERLSASLASRGLEDVEVYSKEGRSRRLELSPSSSRGRRVEQRLEVRSEEAGWAVRAGGRRGSIFACGTGRPAPDGPWPEARGEPLQLPAFREPLVSIGDQAVAPLIVESEALDLLGRFERALAAEVSDARLVRAVVDDGVSDARLRSTRGVDCVQRNRAGALYIEVVSGDVRRAAQLAAGAVVGFDFEAQARRFATLLTLGRKSTALASGSGAMVMAPSVAVRVLAGLLPLLVGGDGWRVARALRDRQGRLASTLLTVIDDGGLEGGVFRAATDGEGVPTRAVTLIDSGEFRQPLLSWCEAPPGRGEASGCMLRPSWRQPPEPGPTHLYVRPQNEVSPAALVGSVSAGFYWLDTTGAGRFDVTGDRFELPVVGFRLRGGRASEPVTGVACGSIGTLLRGVVGVARDLTFYPRRFMLGSPTLLVEGLRLDDGASPG